MKKIFILVAALATTMVMSATTLEWKASSMPDINPDIKNNATFEGTLQVNSNISFEIANGEGTTAPKYRAVTTMSAPSLMFYNNNIWTVAATDATITSIEFVIFDPVPNADNSDSTPEWKVTVDGKTYNAANPIWTGSADTVLITSGAKTSVQGLNIEYTVNGGTEEPGEYQKATLRFTEDQVTPENESAPNVTLSDNEVTLNLVSNSTSASIKSSTAYFGTAESYEKFSYRYGTGTRSSNGTSSNTMGTFTFPCAGTLTIYGYNNNATGRAVEVVQNNATLLSHTYLDTDYVTPDGTTIKVYPTLEVDVEKGTAYLLYPDNQLFFFGFDFEPAEDEENPGGGDEPGEEEPSFTQISYDWTASDLSGYSHSQEIAGEVFSVNKYLSFTTANEEGSTVKYNKTTTTPATIHLYSKNTITFTVPDGCSIESITFQVNTDIAGTGNTPANTPNWVLKEGNTTYNAENPTYTASSTRAAVINTVTFTCNSGTQLTGVSGTVLANSATGVERVAFELPIDNGIIYNLFGQRVDENYKGIVIKNGKKIIQ